MYEKSHILVFKSIIFYVGIHSPADAKLHREEVAGDQLGDVLLGSPQRSDPYFLNNEKFSQDRRLSEIPLPPRRPWIYVIHMN
jgi:hypothetical protein